MLLGEMNVDENVLYQHLVALLTLAASSLLSGKVEKQAGGTSNCGSSGGGLAG